MFLNNIHFSEILNIKPIITSTLAIHPNLLPKLLNNVADVEEVKNVSYNIMKYNLNLDHPEWYIAGLGHSKPFIENFVKMSGHYAMIRKIIFNIVLNNGGAIETAAHILNTFTTKPTLYGVSNIKISDILINGCKNKNQYICSSSVMFLADVNIDVLKYIKNTENNLPVFVDNYADLSVSYSDLLSKIIFEKFSEESGKLVVNKINLTSTSNKNINCMFFRE